MPLTKARFLQILTLNAAALMPSVVIADEYEIEFHHCYGNPKRLQIEGRVIESRGATDAAVTDNWYKNLWRKLRQLKPDHEEHVLVSVVLNNKIFQTRSTEAGFFNFDLVTPDEFSIGVNSITGVLQDGRKTSCNVLIIPPENTVGIISDFDDTVIVTNVLNKQEAVANTLTLNYLQRNAVPGMATWYRKILSLNSNQVNLPLFFVTGSPKELQASIEQFLDYQQFPKRVIIAKTIRGDERDPLFNQLEYKLKKIDHLFAFFPTLSFVLVGDDGEKDPEVYHQLYTRYPERIRSIWIRAVNPSPSRQRFPEQQLFVNAPN